MSHVEMVPSPPFRNVAVHVAKVPLAAGGAAVITRRRGRKHSEHGQDPAANVAKAKVAPKAQLFQLPFVASETLGRSTERVISRMVETVHVIDVSPEFGSEIFRTPRAVLLAAVGVHPRPVRVGKRLPTIRVCRQIGVALVWSNCPGR